MSLDFLQYGMTWGSFLVWVLVITLIRTCASLVSKHQQS
jgi:hypothetical protein